MLTKNEQAAAAFPEVFSIVPEERRFKTKDRHDIERSYILRGCDGPGREAYLTGLAGRMRHNADGEPVGMASFEGLQNALLSRCLYEVQADGTEHPMTATEIDAAAWPAPMLKKLFNEAKRLSALDEDADATAKKS